MSDYFKGFLITFTGVLIISPDALLIRLIDLGTWEISFWRGLFSGLTILIVFWVLRGRRFWPEMMAMGRPGLAVAVIFAFGSLCFIYSLTHTTVANALFIISTSPIFAALLSRVFLGEPVGRRTQLTIVATLFGIAIIASGSFDGHGAALGASLAGDLAGVGAALSLAATFTINRAQKARSMVPAMGLSALIAAGLALFGVSSLAVPAESYKYLLILGLFIVPVGVAAVGTGPRYLPAPDVGLLMLLEAVFGPLLVWLVLAEYPGDRTMIGGTIVLGVMTISNGVALWQDRKRKQVQKAP